MKIVDTFGKSPVLKDDGKVNIRAAPHESARHDANDGANFVIKPHLGRRARQDLR